MFQRADKTFRDSVNNDRVAFVFSGKTLLCCGIWPHGSTVWRYIYILLSTCLHCSITYRKHILPIYVSGLRAFGLTLPASVKRSKLRGGLRGPGWARRRIVVPLFNRNNSLGIMVKALMYFDMLTNKNWRESFVQNITAKKKNFSASGAESGWCMGLQRGDRQGNKLGLRCGMRPMFRFFFFFFLLFVFYR